MFGMILKNPSLQWQCVPEQTTTSNIVLSGKCHCTSTGKQDPVNSILSCKTGNCTQFQWQLAHKDDRMLLAMTHHCIISNMIVIPYLWAGQGKLYFKVWLSIGREVETVLQHVVRFLWPLHHDLW